jgi:hypothetical protein
MVWYDVNMIWGANSWPWMPIGIDDRVVFIIFQWVFASDSGFASRNLEICQGVAHRGLGFALSIFPQWRLE